MMYVPEGDLCNDCGTFMSWDFSLIDDARRVGFAYYSCDSDLCDNFGVFDISF